MGGGSSKTNSTQTVQATLPAWFDAEWKSAIGKATEYADTPFKAYAFPMTAGLTDAQKLATDSLTSKIGQTSLGFNTAQKALSSITGGNNPFVPGGGSGYTAQQVTASNVNAPTVGSTTGDASMVDRSGVPMLQAGNVQDVSAYANPWENTVVNQTMADIARSRDVATNAARARAGAAGAFGGSRSAILETETARPYADAMAREAANLRSQGYTNAQSVASRDADRALAAGQGNQSVAAGFAGQDASARNDMTRTNLGFTNAAQQAQAQYNYGAATGNADRSLAAQTTNQGANQAAADLRARAALGLAGAGQAERAGDLANIEALAKQGLIGQATDQAGLDAQYNEFLRGVADQPEKLQLLLSALGVAPYNQDKTATGQSTTKTNPGLFGWASLLGGGK